MSTPLRVLVVEDNPDGCESLRTLVGLWGHECRTAPDGPAGVGMALRWHPHVALVDLGLPVCDGLEVCRQVRAVLGEDVLLVAVTAYRDDGSSVRAGFDQHLTKPADPEAIRELLDRQAGLLRWEAGDDR
jgi:two-component system CheB/CheR fusion protein